MILTRKEFTEYFNAKQPDIASDTGPLWIPESSGSPAHCQWFVCIPPLSFDQIISHEKYWQWCQQNLQGQIRCFSSDELNQHEWWGFTEHNDIAFWLLRWGQ